MQRAPVEHLLPRHVDNTNGSPRNKSGAGYFHGNPNFEHIYLLLTQAHITKIGVHFSGAWSIKIENTPLPITIDFAKVTIRII